MPDAPRGTGEKRLVSMVCNKMYPFLCLGLLLPLSRNPCQNLSSTVTQRAWLTPTELFPKTHRNQTDQTQVIVRERQEKGRNGHRVNKWWTSPLSKTSWRKKKRKKKGEKSHRLVTTLSTLHYYQHHVFILHMLGVRHAQPWQLNTCTCTTSPFISFICRTVIRAENTLALVFSIICWSACSTPSRICVKEFMILSTELNSLTTKRESSSD